MLALALGLSGFMAACSSPGSALDDVRTGPAPSAEEVRHQTLERSRFLVKWAEEAPRTQSVMLADGKTRIDLEQLMTLSAGYVLMGVANGSNEDASPAQVLSALEKTPGVVAAEIDHVEGSGR